MKKDLKSSMIYYLSLIGFFAIFSTTISKSPVLPLYVQALGGNEIIIGLISAFSPLAGILFSFPVGLMSDKIGRKKLLVISGAIFLVCPLLYLSVDTPMWLIPIRFFHGMATAILGPVTSAMIVEKYAASKGEKLGLYSSSTLVGRALAPMLGGFIIAYFAKEGVSLVGYKYVYAAAFLLAIPVFILTVFLKDEGKGGAKVSTRDFYTDLKYLFDNKRLISTAGVEMAIYFAYGAFETYLPLYLTQLDISASEIGVIFSTQILAIALSKPLFGKLADRVDKRKQIMLGALLLGVSIGVLGFFQSVTAAIVLGLLFGLGLSFSTVATSTYAAEVTSPEKLGSSLGALSAIMDIGQTIGPFATGIAITYFSFRLGFALSFLLIVVTGLIFFVYNRHREHILPLRKQ
ncbi:MAG: MFS transporter [Candidatus Pacebacteria bacterium]|nr:MFS transporter [Candidatus Paceibacterota bacterium]